MKKSKKLVEIETDYSYHWTCPECGEFYQKIERDGDGFDNPVCEKCGVEFENFVNE